MLFPESTEARAGASTGVTGCNSPFSIASGLLDLTLWDEEQFVEMGQRASDRYSLVAGILKSRVDMARDDEHFRRVGELCALVSRF